MAIIYSYPLQTTIDSTDLLTGTKKNATSPSQNPTVCWTMGTLSTFIKDDILGYNVYTSLVTQAGVNNPVATELKNDTGTTFTWTRTGIGEYTITAAGPVFTNAKTIVFLNPGENEDTTTTWERINNNTIDWKVFDSAGVEIDDSITNGAFEIRIYS